ncbi:MAG: M42 family metallopeptidase [candidate division Zixibacteria bacterium]|nr:M42 family metallopeptidase [candidate division Zixibacteria bacterium]
MDNTELMFKELTEAHGVPGHEDAVGSIMEEYLKDNADEISYDRLGSFVARKNGTSPNPKVMIAGHMDEVGFMVREVTPDGYIKFLPLGGWWGHVALAQRVIIKTVKGDVPGIIGSKPPHILPPEERKKVLEIKDLYIDVGAQDKFDVKKKLKIRPGDSIVPVSDFTILANPKMYLAKAWDNRIGCAAVIDVINNFKKVKHPNTIYGVGTVQEEVGLRGAMTAANYVDPDVGFAVDVSIARDMPGMDGKAAERCGTGPSIAVYDGSLVPNRKLRDLVIDTAEKNKIPYHLTALEQGGTDGGRIHLNRIGVPTIYMGVATRYIHGHAGILNRNDYNNLVKLLTAVIKTLNHKTVNSLVRGGNQA